MSEIWQVERWSGDRSDGWRRTYRGRSESIATESFERIAAEIKRGAVRLTTPSGYQRIETVKPIEEVSV